MRAPPRGSGLERYFDKPSLSFEEFDTLFHFLNTSRTRVLKMTHFRKNVKSNWFLYYFFTRWKNRRFTLGVLQKSSSDHFNRVFPLFYACENVLISLGGAHFFDQHRAISTRGSNENCFFPQSVEKSCSRSRGVSKVESKAFQSSFSLFFARQNVLISFAKAHIFDFCAHVSSESAIFIDFGPRAGSGSIF